MTFEQVIENIFHDFDNTGKGALNHNEASRFLKCLFRTFGVSLPSQKIDLLLFDLDRDGDGIITKQEFLLTLAEGMTLQSHKNS